MKLISRFKNYYDHCIYHFGVDPLIVWNREPKRLSIIDYCKEKKPNSYARVKELFKNKNAIDAALLRELFPITKLDNSIVIVVNDKVYYYAYKKFDSINKNSIYPDGFCSISEMFNKQFRKGKSPADLKFMFDSGILNDDEWVSLRKFFKTPIIVYGHQLMKSDSNKYFENDLSNNYFVESGLFSNPDISQYPLSKDMGPMDAYKAVLAAFCCDMVIEDPAQQPEYTRIEAAGFDLKKSFRKNKS